MTKLFIWTETLTYSLVVFVAKSNQTVGRFLI